jgi:hypothetical protein
MSSKIRPKTGFRQKNNNELNYVTFTDIDKYADLLYEDKNEDKIKGARNILYLVREPICFQNLIEDKKDTLGILARTLRDENKKTMELTIILLSLFGHYSYYDNFHSTLSSMALGETCMNIIDFNYMKYEYRKDEIMRFSKSKTMSENQYQLELEKFLFSVRKQDRIMYLSFLILLRLASDIRVEYKMVKKDIVTLILKNIDRQNLNLLYVLLAFLKKLSCFAQNKDVMIKGGVLDKLMKLFEIDKPEIRKLVFEIIYNLSFDKKFKLQFLSNKKYFEIVNKNFKLPENRANILKIFYNLSLEEKSLHYFAESDCLNTLFELIDKFPEKKLGRELSSLTLNLVKYTPNANIMAESGKIKKMVKRALQSKDADLLKIINTILKYSDNDDIDDILEKYIDDYFMKILFSKSWTTESLIEVIEILSYIDTDWSERLEKFNLIPFFEKELKETKDETLLISLITFIGNICKDSASIGSIVKSNIINLLHLLLSNNNNPNIVFGIIYALYQLIGFEEPKKVITSNDDLIQKILSMLGSTIKEISFLTKNFLEVVAMSTHKWESIINEKIFEHCNAEFINKIKTISAYGNYNEMENDLADDDDVDVYGWEGNEMYGVDHYYE